MIIVHSLKCLSLSHDKYMMLGALHTSALPENHENDFERVHQSANGRHIMDNKNSVAPKSFNILKTSILIDISMENGPETITAKSILRRASQLFQILATLMGSLSIAIDENVCMALENGVDANVLSVKKTHAQTKSRTLVSGNV